MIDECESYLIPTEIFLDMVVNPFEEIVWQNTNRPASMQNVLSYLEASDFEITYHDASLNYPIEWHERRIAYLASLIQSGVTLEPCDIDIPVPELGGAPFDVMLDGYHRLCAHLATESLFISVTPIGDLDAFEEAIGQKKRHECGAFWFEP